jgi:hypothetical protein
MSNTQYAFLRSESLPSRSTLQGWIDSLGFDLKLCPDLALKTDRGFSPCILSGVEDVGIELWPSDVAEMAAGNEEILRGAEGRDFCISMTWRSSMKDCAAVMIVSCALAKFCDAVISYEGDAPEPLDKMLAATVGIVEDARSES